MPKFRAFLCLSVPCLGQAMDPGVLRDALDKGEFDVLTVSRDYCRDDIAVLSPDNFNAILNGVVSLAKEARSSSVPLFVVFSEYACSRQTLDYETFMSLLNCVIEVSRKPECNLHFYYVNFLHKLGDPPPQSDVGWLTKYLEDVLDAFMIDGNKSYTWPNLGLDSFDAQNIRKTIEKGVRGYFANETSVVHRGRVISRYRKATYCREYAALLCSGWVYLFGRGYDEPADKDSPLAWMLVSKVGTDICRDVAMECKLWLQRLKKAQRDESFRQRFFAGYQRALDFIKGFSIEEFARGAPTDLSDLKLRIIQSNSIGLSDYMSYFENGQIVIQSDPNVAGVMRIRYPEYAIAANERRCEDRKEAGVKAKKDDKVEAGWVPSLNAPFICHPVEAKIKPKQVSVQSDDKLTRTFTCMYYEVKGGQ